MPIVKNSRPVRAREFFKKLSVTAVVAVGLAVAAPATPASAANRVDCGGLSPIDEYVQVMDDSWYTSTCFANAGAMNVDISGITYFHSGNNKVTFYYTVEENGYQTSLTLEKWQEHTLSWGLHCHVTALVIW